MYLCKKTLEKLRNIINGDNTDDYKSGPMLVAFFNELGLNNFYGKGFPSRWFFTDDQLNKINGSAKLDECIKSIFAVNNYIGRIGYLDKLIAEFNQYLMFDKWEVIRDNGDITFKKLDKIIIENQEKKIEISENEFLNIKFEISVEKIGLEFYITKILSDRIVEIDRNISIGNSLSSIILIGSVMEGILLGMAQKHPDKFNKSKSAPMNKNSTIVKKFNEWTLSDFINSAYELDIIKEDIKKFSHVVREYRNYIHPYQQLCSQFNPDKHTASICFQVLKAMAKQFSSLH